MPTTIWIPQAGFQVDGSSQESMEKFANVGLSYGCYDDPEEPGYIMTSPSSPVHARVFYYEEDETHFTVCACSNVQPVQSNFIQQVIYIKDYWGGQAYYYTTKNLLQSTVISGTTVYYTDVYTILRTTSNPQIPIFNSLNAGLTQANTDGWQYVDPSNPYEFDDSAISYAGGGTGSFDNTSDTVGVPALPTLSAVSAGFISMYSPTLTQLNQLASFLWTDNMFDPDNFKKLFTDPMECIIGLTIVPVNPTSAGSTNVKVGYVDTGISMPRLSSQYAEVNCGTIQAKEFWGSALDYAPMTRIHLYLPYIGIREINADEVMNKSIGVVYHIDLLSGALTAFVTANGSVLYQFNGQCALNVPMASSNFTNMIQGAITSIGTVASGIATGGSSVGAGMALSAVQIGASAANNAISNKPSFSHSGSMGGAGGMLGVQTPYLIIDRPRQSMPEGMNKFCGFPSNIYYKLYDLDGFTQVEYIHLDNIPATGAELDEIEGLLRKGVIL